MGPYGLYGQPYYSNAVGGYSWSRSDLHFCSPMLAIDGCLVLAIQIYAWIDACIYLSISVSSPIILYPLYPNLCMVPNLCILLSERDQLKAKRVGVGGGYRGACIF